MKKRALVSLLCGIMMFSMVSCTIKITPNTNIQNIEGNGNLIINSNLMNSLNNAGPSYEFIPLEYKGGVARGIVSPTKIDKYRLDGSYPGNRGELNPLRYTEYTINANQFNGILKETGEILNLNEISPYNLNVENPKNIVLKDNKRKIEKTYMSKSTENFRVEESEAYSMEGIPFKTSSFYNKDGMNVNISTSASKIVGKDNRYVYSSFAYGENLDNNGYPQKYNNVMAIYDSKTESFYESDITETTDYYYTGQEIFEVNNEIYNININGKINKVILSDGKILFEDYYDLKLEANQILSVTYAYGNNNTVVGDNIFVSIGTKNSHGGSTSLNDSVINLEDKEIIDLPAGNKYVSIGKIFSNSNDLATISIDNDIWIARYEDGEFNKLVQIDKYSSNGMPIQARSIEDILYDDETNSCFIKRKISIDKKQSYQYEVLKLE